MRVFRSFCGWLSWRHSGAFNGHLCGTDASSPAWSPRTRMTPPANNNNNYYNNRPTSTHTYPPHTLYFDTRKYNVVLFLVKLIKDNCNQLRTPRRLCKRLCVSVKRTARSPVGPKTCGGGVCVCVNDRVVVKRIEFCIEARTPHACMYIAGLCMIMPMC